MSSLPLGPTACLSSRVLKHICIAVDNEIMLVFPRGIPYAKIKKLADSIPGSELRLIKVRTTYEVLTENEVYDTSAKVTY